MRSDELDAEVARRFPGLAAALQREREFWHPDPIGVDIVLASHLVPFVVDEIRATSAGDLGLVARELAAFVEELATSDDELLRDAAVVSVLQALEDRPDELERLKPFLGPVALSLLPTRYSQHTPADDPEPIQRLIRTLEAAGFERIKDTYDPNAFGHIVRTCADGPLRVRMSRNRGDWSIGLTLKSWDQWFEPSVWEAAQPGSSGPTPGTTISQEADLLLGSLDEIRERVSAGRITLGRLVDTRDERARGRRTGASDRGW